MGGNSLKKKYYAISEENYAQKSLNYYKEYQEKTGRKIQKWKDSSEINLRHKKGIFEGIFETTPARSGGRSDSRKKNLGKFVDKCSRIDSGVTSTRIVWRSFVKENPRRIPEGRSE